MEIRQTYSFDDVLLVPKFSSILPEDTDLTSNFTPAITLSTPFVSAAMDTVTESKMAIALAQLGGIGCIHRNLSMHRQSEEVKKVKKYESWIVSDPLTIFADESVASVVKLQKENNLSGIPVLDRSTNKLVGVVTNRDVRFADAAVLVSDVMSKNLITTTIKVTKKEALSLLHKNRIERLLVVDSDCKCIGLVTVRDILKFDKYPNAAKDSQSRLRVAAAVGTDANAMQRSELLVASGVDTVVVDASHGHSFKVINFVKELRGNFPDLQIVAGNVVTQDGALALINAGANSIKVGIGPGSICTTRVVCGVGVPQFSAIYDVASVCKSKNITVIADGGIRNSGDVAKAIAAGADTVMIGSLFAGTTESPGDIVLLKGRSYKSHRGMGSIASMKLGSSDRYFQAGSKKPIAQGVEGLTPYKGKIADVVGQLSGGLRCSMGYTGHSSLKQMQQESDFVKITNASLIEGSAHDIKVTRDDSSCKFNDE